MEDEEQGPGAGAPDVADAPPDEDLVDDWLEQTHLLPAVPPPFSAHPKYTRLFALDVGGQPGHDQYVYVVPNGLCVVGLAPSHPWVRPAPAAAAQQPEGMEQQQQQQPPLQAPDAAADGVGGGGAAAAAAAVDGALPASELQGAGTAATEGEATPQAGQGEAAARGAAQQQQQQQQQEPQRAQQPAAPHHSHNHHGGRSRHKRKADGDPHAPADEAAGAQGAGQGAAGTAAQPSPGSTVTVSFDVGKRNANVKQSGKRRNQGSLLDGESVLCMLSDGHSNTLAVKAVAMGKLLEVNQRLLKEPHLLAKREGFLAILFPTESQLAGLKRRLTPVDDYLRARGLTEAALF